MRDQFTVISNESWVIRLGTSIKGAFIGLILAVIAFALLFWNEGRAIRRYETLAEGGKNLVSVTAENIDAANNGKLVHIIGQAVTDATLTDPDFDVSVSALRLERDVKMYQWAEKSEQEKLTKTGGHTQTATTYEYVKEWSGVLINSRSFRNQTQYHVNPDVMPYSSRKWTAEPVKLGAFQLPASLVNRIEAGVPVTPQAVPPALQQQAHLYGGGFYIGDNPDNRAIGDLRITYKAANSGQVSVIAQQSGDTLTPYTTASGGTIELISPGSQPASGMIKMAQQSNQLNTWLLRAGGFLLMLYGFYSVFVPLGVLADVVPVLGTITRAGTGFISMLLAAALSALTIAAGWLSYRPQVGLGLIAAAIVIFIVIGGKLGNAPAPGQPGQVG